MIHSRHLSLLVLIACIGTAWAAPAKREPHIGYLFPAGGRRGSTFDVIVGGQMLRGAADVYISGKGVHASVVHYYKPRRNLQPNEREILQRRLLELKEKRLAELPGDMNRRAIVFPGERPGRMGMGRKRGGKKKATPKTGKAELPDHPLLRNLENMSLRELYHVADTFFNPNRFRKIQLNTQLAELLLIRVTVDPDAEPGDRELRLRTSLGLTNPMCFQVGTLPEVREDEPNDPRTFDPFPKEPPIELPVVLNGQITPGDVDRFRFRAKKGQRLVVETQARHLVPFLADAVPGWFQATVALYDSQGREVAFADDYRFHPDPVLFYEIPEDGEYELEIRDALYRGREDFVYRIAVGELPFITRMFPLGGQAGVPTVASVGGWHLPGKQLRLNTEPAGDLIRRAVLRRDGCISNEVLYAVDTLPECNESEPNDDTKNAQQVALPRIINGRIARPGDADVFRFEGRAGDDIVVEVLARRLYSPLDSLVRVTDASGSVLGWNDDYVQKEDKYLFKGMGYLTHHADSYLTVRLPKDGVYYVHLTDTQNHGGEAYGYRLRVSPPRPDFALRITPSSLTVLAGRVIPVTVHALRKDGFDGDIEVVLKDAPAGFVLSGGRIPAGRDRVRMTLTAPRESSGRPITLHLEGRARIGGNTIVRPVVPSEDVMQAFLYRHLVPSQQFLVAVMKMKWKPPPIELANQAPIQVPAGGTAQVRLRMPRYLARRKIRLELNEAEKGVTLQDVRPVPEGLAFQLKVEGDAAKAGYADNLIVEVFLEPWVNPKAKKTGKPAKQRPWASLGILPAIPFVVVQS